MKRREFLEEKIALYLASEFISKKPFIEADAETLLKTTPFPEMAKDIVDIVYETLVLPRND